MAQGDGSESCSLSARQPGPDSHTPHFPSQAAWVEPRPCSWSNRHQMGHRRVSWRVPPPLDFGLLSRTPLARPLPAARPPRPAQALTIVAAAWPAPLLCQKSGRAQSLGGSRGAERGRGGGTLSEQRLGPSSNRKQTATATGVLRAPPPGPLATSFGW